MLKSQLLSLLAFTGLAVAWVELDPALIPQLPDPLPIYSLGSPSFFPDDWLTAIVGNTASGGHTKRHNEDPRHYIYNGDEIVGFVDKQTGETEIFPDYDALQPFSQPVSVEHVIGAFADQKGLVFPPDDTLTELVEGSSLQGSELNAPAEGSGTTPEGSGTVARRSNDTGTTYLTLGTVQRFVEVGGQKYPVCGPGSRATFGVGAENKVVSLSYFWKPAKKTEKTRTAFPSDKVVKCIKEALEPRDYYQGKHIKVDNVDACFYDSGEQYLQPVYRVLAAPFDPNSNSTVAPKQFLEYVPVGGDSIESLVPAPSKDLGSPDGEGGPDEPNSGDNAARSLLNYFDARNEARAPKPRITVGVYVVRNDNAGFLEDARNFWARLSVSPTVNFVRTQYYWAYEWLYSAPLHNVYVNNVNVALSEAHGTFHGFTTYDATTATGFVRIPGGIAPGGYGPISNGGKGKLGYWFIDACEVMPTLPDFQGYPAPSPLRRTFDPWWPVFRGGIHAVLSWRTSALFADNAAAGAAHRIAIYRRPVVYAWLDAAHTDDAYKVVKTYTRGGQPGKKWPFGRAAAMYRCGRIKDKVTNLEKLAPPTCLSVRWWNN